MPNATLTVSALAGLEVNGPVPPLNAAELQQLAESLRGKAKEIAGLSKYDLGDRLLGMLGGSLRKPLAGLLSEFWKQRSEMRDIAAKKGKERDVIGDVELYDHSLTWKLQPAVKVVLNVVGVPPIAHTMRFDVTVKLTLEGLRLIMKNACITSVETGTLKSLTTLKYGDFELLPPINRKVNLPGHLDIPGGGICLS